jgi:hypothetical protein
LLNEASLLAIELQLPWRVAELCARFAKPCLGFLKVISQGVVSCRPLASLEQALPLNADNAP